MNDRLKTGVQKALKMEAVPVEKFGTMLNRTIVGLVLIGLGAFLLRSMLNVYESTQALSIPLLLAGIGAVMVGSIVGSSQVVARTIMETIKGLFRIAMVWKRGNGHTDGASA